MLIVFDTTNSYFIEEVFGTADFAEAKELFTNALDETNESELNRRLMNVITQLKKENCGNNQCFRLMFLE